MCVCLRLRDPEVPLVTYQGVNCLAARLKHISYMLSDYRPRQSLFNSAAVESSRP